MPSVNKWTVIFLGDNHPQNGITLLKRSSKAVFAPNFFTGIGGKIGDLLGTENESEIESAYRELSEETEGQLNITNTNLIEFARCIYTDGSKLYYFWGKHPKGIRVHVDPKDGSLVQVNVDNILKKKFIPTTEQICKEWKKRNFQINLPFTIWVRQIGMKNTVKLIEVVKVKNGLF